MPAVTRATIEEQIACKVTVIEDDRETTYPLCNIHVLARTASLYSYEPATKRWIHVDTLRNAVARAAGRGLIEYEGESDTYRKIIGVPAGDATVTWRIEPDKGRIDETETV